MIGLIGCVSKAGHEPDEDQGCWFQVTLKFGSWCNGSIGSGRLVGAPLV